MFLLPEILLLCLFVFLYCLFVLTKDDFILLRKNVSLEQLFSMTFGVFLFGLLIARIFYVAEHISRRYIDPLVFFLFPYFPGLSLIGGILGGLLLLWYISLKKKFPFGRIVDIVSASFFLVYSIGLLLVTFVDVFATRKFSPVLFGIDIGFFLFSLIFFRLFLKSSFKDGSIGFIGFAVFSLLNTGSIFLSSSKNFLHITAEEAVFFIATFIFFALFIQQEKLSTLFKGGRKK